jgi:betaine-aldehyde dehydrogenase
MWRADPLTRSRALSHLADAFEQRQGDVVATLCRENGKIRGEAAFEANFIVRGLRFSAGLATQLFGRVLEPQPGMMGMTLRQPVGVAGIIVPWNSPAYLCIRSLAPALAAGCAAAVKMPGQAAQIAGLLSEIIGSIPELSGGIVNIFTETGSEGARFLVESPRVPVISFTGSTAVGRTIAEQAAKHLKRVGLELGGKTPHLVFDDADLARLLPVLVHSCTVFAGQFCMTGSRILVQRGIAETLKAELAERLQAVRIGPAADAASEMGPLISFADVTRVDRVVERAIADGARPILRGGPATDADLEGGAFFRPALLEVSDNALPIIQQETFGPVQTLQVFGSEDEAISLANNNEYGLAACIWSRDVDRPMRVARQLDAGTIFINDWANMAVELEEGGFKSSGLGRLGGAAGIDDFLEYKTINQNFAAR